MKAPANGGPFRRSSVAVIAAAIAPTIGHRPLRAGVGAPGKRAAQLVPELIIAGIGIVWSLVLAVGVWIELSAVTGVVDTSCAVTGAAAMVDTRAKAPNSANLVTGVLLDWK
jgi:hypothetical protein